MEKTLISGLKSRRKQHKRNLFINQPLEVRATYKHASGVVDAATTKDFVDEWREKKKERPGGTTCTSSTAVVSSRQEAAGISCFVACGSIFS